MIKLITIFILVFVTYPNVIYSQNVKVNNIGVDDLLKRITTTSDTIYIVNFWATWCLPCIKEIPEFNKIKTTYKNKPVKVIMANLDFPNQKESRLIPFMRNNVITHEVVLTVTPRGGEWINIVDSSWSGAIPATLVIHKNKRRFYEGELKYDDIVGFVESVL
jgi:thiol-disulfide isomerase/thioredoxin